MAGPERQGFRVLTAALGRQALREKVAMQVLLVWRDVLETMVKMALLVEMVLMADLVFLAVRVKQAFLVGPA